MTKTQSNIHKVEGRIAQHNLLCWACASQIFKGDKYLWFTFEYEGEPDERGHVFCDDCADYAFEVESYKK